MNYSTTFRQKYIICLILSLILFSINISLVDSYGVALVVSILCLLVLGIKFKTLNKHFFIVILYVILFFALDSFTNYSLTHSFLTGSAILILFLLGEQIGLLNDRKIKEAGINIVYYILSFLIIGSVAYSYIFKGGLNDRQPYIIFTSVLASPTHFGSLSTVPMAISFIKKDGIHKKSNLINLIALIISNMLMANRVIFIFFGVLLIIKYIFFTDKAKKSKSTLLLFFGIALLLLFVFLISYTNCFSSLLIKIPVFERIIFLNESGYKDPRLERQIYIISHFFENFTGGGYFSKTIGECHNVWLDIYDYAGLIPFSLFLIISIICIKKCISLYKNNHAKDMYVNCLIMTCFAYFLAFFEEPVFRSTESYFILFFFFFGMIVTEDDKLRCLI